MDGRVDSDGSTTDWTEYEGDSSIEVFSEDEDPLSLSGTLNQMLARQRGQNVFGDTSSSDSDMDIFEEDTEEEYTTEEEDEDEDSDDTLFDDVESDEDITEEEDDVEVDVEGEEDEEEDIHEILVAARPPTPVPPSPPPVRSGVSADEVTPPQQLVPAVVSNPAGPPGGQSQHGNSSADTPTLGSAEREDSVAPAEAEPSATSASLPTLGAGTSDRLNSSSSEFRSPKKYAPTAVAPVPAEPQAAPAADEEGAAECPICFEEWSNSGAHRLSSLKCGHLFGQSCIEKWLKTNQPGRCPQCKGKATKKDIRPLFAKALRTVDTSERDRALSELEKERQARREAELASAQARIKHQMAQEEVQRLRQELERCRQQVQNNSRSAVGAAPGLSQATQPSSSQVMAGSSSSFMFDRVVKVWDAGNCRVMAYNPNLATLVVSQPSASPLFPGFGVKKISSLDFKTSQYVSIHQNVIRDVAFNPTTGDGLLLSASIDKTVKVTSLTSNTVVQTYNCQRQVWACIWNPDNTNMFYAGQQDGAVKVFDTRNTSEAVQCLRNPGQSAPVVSLQYLGRNNDSSLRPGGLLVGQLSKSFFWELKSDEDYAPHMLPLENQLTCLSVDSSTRHILASNRPTPASPSARHMMYQMTGEETAGMPLICVANKIHTFHGGSTQKLLTRSSLIHHPADQAKLLVCAPDEASLSVFIWDTSTGNLCQKLPAHAPVLDLCAIPVNGATYLAALTEKAIRLYKWNTLTVS